MPWSAAAARLHLAVQQLDAQHGLGDILLHWFPLGASTIVATTQTVAEFSEAGSTSPSAADAVVSAVVGESQSRLRLLQCVHWRGNSQVLLVDESNPSQVVFLSANMPQPDALRVPAQCSQAVLQSLLSFQPAVVQWSEVLKAVLVA